MTRRDHAGDKPDEADRSAEQPGTDKTADGAAMTQAQPDGDAGSEVQQAEAVWDQPLPWAAPGDGPQDPSASPAQPPQAEPAADGESTTAAQVDTGTGDEADGARSQAAEDQAAVAAASPSSKAPQPDAPQGSRDTQAKQAPLSAGAVGSPGSRRFLGVAVAVGGLLAAVGGVVAFHPDPTAGHVKHDAAPILGPAEGGGGAATPTPTATSRAGKKPHPPALHVVKSTPMAGRPGSAAGTKPTVDHVTQPLAATTKQQHVQQQSYLSVSTSVYKQNPYWSQSTVTVTTKAKLTALKIVVRINQTGGVESTGTWTSLGDKVTVHSTADSRSLDYVLVLNPGVTVDPGTYTFEFQYNHHQGTRDSSHDSFAVTATAPGSAGTESKQGHF
ncbi:hypothetical protein [Streptomyces sp. TRM68367]|uniref:hypothetical protein n=1 Tax=Streptomyces sp. TRM68367 TaxID=2758415 RepID=UPI00165AB9AA|nr:hypothetical protein [Streptomyces sp. TRM68367]MBC9726009.1 hypothetical protein [Streptomyces sp. TRM68367]